MNQNKSEKIAPKKSLGQNFLTDKNIANKIVDTLGDINGQKVFEIGPGMGAITGLILDRKPFLSSIELDKRAIDYLKTEYSTQLGSNFELIHSSILDFDLPNYIHSNNIKEKVAVIGNIPYNISSEIFFWIYKNAKYIDRSVLMIQKEVAKRLVAKPRTKDYGILTLAMELCGKAKIAFDVPSGAFFPRPNVTSSVIRFDLNSDTEVYSHFDKMMKLIRASFSQRRKMLGNSLKQYFDAKSINKDSSAFVLLNDKYKFLSKRAEELTLNDFFIMLKIIETGLDNE